MNLRKLEIKDAPLMLEWMHDFSVVENMHSNFASKTIKDCEEFIKNSFSIENIHFAVVSDQNEYMGTVSLKHIDRINSTAEFAITIRKIAMGCGYAWFGMHEILKYGFEKEKLNSIYWCVSKDNARACRFYDKHHFKEMFDVRNDVLEHYKEIENLKWYVVNSSDNFSGSERNDILGCKVINVKTIGTEGAGQLSFFEGSHDVPFDIKRIYYISKVPEGIRRGFHAHKKLKQLLFCPYGKINLILDNGINREEILLDNPSIGVLIEKPMWREMLWIQKDSVLCVAASDFYDVEDYVRDYSEFKKLANK